MTKAELIDAVAKSADVSKADAERTVGAFFDIVAGAAKTGDKVAWPGFGSYLTSSLLLGDMNAVMGSVLIVGIVFIALNLLSDALYQVFDPRTRQ